MSKPDGYIKSLDGMRALAILLVMTFHAKITHFGWMGVQLFFVLSGFLITGILWRDKFKPLPLSFKFKKFWFRRTLRIFPLYFAYLLLLGLTFLLFNFPDYYQTYAPYLFTYTFNYTRLLSEWQGNPLFTHLWSLSVEEQFYLVFPLIMFLLPARLLKYFLVIMILLGPVIRYFLGEYYLGRGATPEVAADAVYWNTLSHMDAFFMGGIISVFALEKRITKPGMLVILFAILACGAGVLNFIDTRSTDYLLDLGYSHAQAGNYQYVWQYTFLNLLFASCILYLLSAETPGKRSLSKKLMENEWLVRLGRVSYGMYIFHWLVYVYIFQRFVPDNLFLRLLIFILYTAVVYLIAELSFRLFEARFLKMKDKLFVQKKAARVENSGVPVDQV
jgi:peptidoglycan/LPS O-acetylase OafA/YrhL